MISHSDIGQNDKAVYCIVNDDRCCTGSAAAKQRGNWYLPNEFLLNATEKSNYSATHAKGAVLLNYHGESSGISGILRCNILDQSNTLHSFFIGVYNKNEGTLETDVNLDVLISYILYWLINTLPHFCTLAVT